MTAGTVYKVVKDDTQKLNLILFTYNQLVGFTGWREGSL